MKRVYFIRPIGMDGPVKIGCSYSPTKRRTALACWCPFPLEIVAEIPGDGALERRFHALFYDSWQGSEWFTWSPALQLAMDSVAAGTFDISGLPEPRFLPRVRQKKTDNGWSPIQKLKQSYCIRIRHAQKKHGFHLPRELEGWRSFMDDPVRMARVDDFLRDPEANGITGAERRAAVIADLRKKGDAFSQQLIGQLEAA